MPASNLNIKQLPLQRIFSDIWRYISTKNEVVAIFSIINFAFLGFFSIFVQNTSSGWFLPWICGYYAFCFAFFRFYYNKKPILFTKQILGTLAPSTKILFIVFSLTLLVILLPFLPLFIGYNEEYAFFIDKYMSSMQTLGQNADPGSQNILPVTILNIILLLLSPIIFIRPMFAWISSLIGRSGSLRNAFNNTQGNYWRFLAVFMVFELPILVLEILFKKYQLNDIFMWLIISPIMILGEVAIAKCYDYFFLELDNG